MKIINIALNGVYSDGFSYHENLLPKFHKILGHEVHVLASEYSFDNQGNSVKITDERNYVDENGVYIHRLPIRHNRSINYKFKKFEGLYEIIEEIDPDIIFCHLFQFLDVLKIVKYKMKHRNVVLFLDSHADFSNSASNKLSLIFLHGVIWKYCAHKALPYTEVFYGVLPARVDFLINVYKLPKEKVELLVMGADDQIISSINNSYTYSITRKKYGINDNDFLIITGGKIDFWKKQTLLLMDAINEINDDSVKLLVFGSIVNELQNEVIKRCTEKVKYIGWLDNKETYPLFACSNVAVFPGRHSVFWEQVVGQGIPIVVKHWEGTTHIDLNGNCAFLYEDSKSEILEVINSLITNKEKYNEMKKVAIKKAHNFSYKYLANKSITTKK